MRAAGRPGRGERARVAARVRELLAQHADSPAARTFSDDPAEPPSAWLPDADFERHVPRHESPSADRDRAFGAGLRSRLRWDPGRRGAAALGVLLVAVVAATGWWLAAGRPHESALPASSEAAGSAPVPSGSVGASPAPVSESAVTPVASPAPSSGASSIVVDVDGKVRRPGLYTLAPGSRVNDAVEAAGGVRPGVRTVSLNLAQPISDGEQIVVGRASGTVGGGAPVVGASNPDPASSSATVVDLNTATLTDLETLPGIGPALGQQILDWRSAHGQFTSVEQLQDVSGIGDVRYAEISPLVTV